MKELNKSNISKFKYMEFTLVNTPKNFTFPIHFDSKLKLISIVIYISPEKKYWDLALRQQRRRKS